MSQTLLMTYHSDNQAVMKTYKEKDSNVSELVVGDILEMEDGTRHEAVQQEKNEGCRGCSIESDDRECRCWAVQCSYNGIEFRFKKL